ncbi:MAG: tetratricopeptide repeat protein [Deltaproteobacteria bacterium]|nr:tetratricopeptide repeat protein [Deltaproteobacteria bacterium]MCW5802692.1 tetratricopeptide repeat protein [Deltaproteobacteria bacterium]
MKNKIIIAALTLAAAACGGGTKGGAGGTIGTGKAPPPPPTVKPGGDGAGEKREISQDEKKDFDSAFGFFSSNDKGQWNDGACRSAADKFTSVVRAHPNSVEAQYMVGLSFHRCNLLKEAEGAYQAAIRIKQNHGQSLSNLGEIYYRSGQNDAAKKYWDNAINANGKLVAARNNLASMELEQLRKMPEKERDGKQWKELESDARFNLSNVLGVDSDNVKAYTLYGLVYMEGFQKNKSRLDLAKLLLDEANKRNPKFAPLQNAYGLYYMHRGALSEALQHFTAAVEIDPKFIEARMNVGLTTLGFRKYDVAKDQFTKVLELQSKNYDAVIGLGVALRGLKDFDGAEKQYKAAVALDGKRGEAYYNLAVLAKDFRATKLPPKEAIPVLKGAQGYFKDFISKGGDAKDLAEAKVQVGLIDKQIASNEKFLKDQASAPPPKPPAGGAAPPPAKP